MVADHVKLLVPSISALHRVNVVDAEAYILQTLSGILKAMVMHQPKDNAEHLNPYKMPLRLLGHFMTNEDPGFRGDAWEMAVFHALATRTPLSAIMAEVLESEFDIPEGRDVIFFAPNVACLSGRESMLTDAERQLADNAVLVTRSGNVLLCFKEIAIALLQGIQEKTLKLSENYPNGIPSYAHNLGKADLLVGNRSLGKWVAVSIKRNEKDIRHDETAISIGIYRVGPGSKIPSEDWSKHKHDPAFIIIPVLYDGDLGMFFDSCLKAIRVFRGAQIKLNVNAQEELAGDLFAWSAYNHLVMSSEYSISSAIKFMWDIGCEKAENDVLIFPSKIPLSQKVVLGPNGSAVRSVNVDVSAVGRIVFSDHTLSRFSGIDHPVNN